jgi:hypothetical protein
MPKQRIGVSAAMAFAVLLCGCSSTTLPPLREDRTAVISSHDIFFLHPSDYVTTTLSRAAQITVEHGYRYFTIIPRNTPIQVGRDTEIKVYSADEIAPGTRGVWDADKILNGSSR